MEESVNGKIDTKRISRRHVIEQSKSGLISLMGGKWTIYRQMGQDVVDKIMKEMHERDNMPFIASKTSSLKLIGDEYPEDFKKTLA